jgi:hypothetical protein
MAIGIDIHNKNAKPFLWTAKAADILERVTRQRTALHQRLSVWQTPLGVGLWGGDGGRRILVVLVGAGLA